MTITSANRKAGPYLGNGVTTAFPFEFKVFKKEDVAVTFTDVNGTDDVLTLDSDYSVTLNSDQDNDPGGTITYPRVGSSLPNLQTGEKLTLSGGLAYTQPTDLPNLSPYFPEVVEDALDRAEIQIQQIKEIADRAIKISVSDTPLTPLPSAPARANTVIGFDALGNVTTLPIPSSIGAGDRIPQTFVAGVDFNPGVTTQLVLARAPGAPGNLELFFDPLFQGFDQWSVDGTLLTFASPIPIGVTKIFAYIGTTLSLQVPPARSVGEAQLLWAGILNRVVGTLGELKALDVSQYTNAYTIGRNAPDDGVDGAWRFDAASSATPNDATIVQPNSGIGRWFRIFPGDTLKACWFGAGMGAADDTAAITAALAATPTGGTLDFEGRTYNLIPSTNVAYKDKFNVTRKTAVQMTGRSKLALLFREGSKIVVNGTDAERVAFFLKSCSGITIAAPNFPNVSGNTSIAGSGYLDSENYFPFAFEGNDGIYIHRPNFEACRSALMADAFNGLQNKNIVIEKMHTYQVCNYSIITRNADNVQVLDGRFEQTGRSWNTSNEDVAFSDTSTNCKAVNCDAIAPIGRVSRFTSVNNAGPTIFENNRLNGGGIWVEINQGSKVQVIGGYSNNQVERVSSHILFTSDLFYGNDNCSVVGAHFYGGGAVISDYYVSGWGGADIPGLVFKDCVAVDAYGPQMATTRVGVVFEGNRFDLNDSGILVRPGGKGTVFANNSIKNGYVRVDGDNFKATGNDMTGKVGSPIAFAWDVQGCLGFVERDNTYTPSSYTQFYNHAPGARFGARYLEVGINSNPQFSLAAFVTGVLGDFFKNDAPVDGSPEGWVCTAAGSPGVWRERGQNGFRSSLGAPSVNAIYVGEELLDTTNNKWYKAKNTGTGATDWVALN